MDPICGACGSRDQKPLAGRELRRKERGFPAVYKNRLDDLAEVWQRSGLPTDGSFPETALEVAGEPRATPARSDTNGEAQKPARELLEWHADTVFKG
jgi:hypothetical protein